jgi:hypothetical protein
MVRIRYTVVATILIVHGLIRMVAHPISGSMFNLKTIVPTLIGIAMLVSIKSNVDYIGAPCHLHPARPF